MGVFWVRSLGFEGVVAGLGHNKLTLDSLEVLDIILQTILD